MLQSRAFKIVGAEPLVLALAHQIGNISMQFQAISKRLPPYPMKDSHSLQ